MRRRRHPFTLAPAHRTHRPADILRNVSHTIRTINNDYNGRYGRPIVWKEASQRARHWTESNEIILLSLSLFSLSLSLSLSLSVCVCVCVCVFECEQRVGLASLPLALERRAQRERCPNTKRNVIIHS